MLRIVCDSMNPNSLRVIDVETGAQLQGVMGAEIILSPGEVNKVILTMALESCDVVALSDMLPSVEIPIGYPGSLMSKLGDFSSGQWSPEASAQRWDEVHRQLAQVTKSLDKIQPESSHVALNSTAKGLMIDNGYDGMNSR